MTTDLASLAIVALVTPIADKTGINDALIRLAQLGAGFLGGALTVALVILGYQYLFTDESSRGMHLKRGLVTVLGGAILILAAVTLAPQIITTMTTHQTTQDAPSITAPTPTPTPTPTPVPAPPPATAPDADHDPDAPDDNRAPKPQPENVIA